MNDGAGDSSGGSDLSKTIVENLLKDLESSDERKKAAAAQVRTLLEFMVQEPVRLAIASAVEELQSEYGEELQSEYGEDPELINAFFPIQKKNDGTDGEGLVLDDDDDTNG